MVEVRGVVVVVVEAAAREAEVEIQESWMAAVVAVATRAMVARKVANTAAAMEAAGEAVATVEAAKRREIFLHG